MFDLNRFLERLSLQKRLEIDISSFQKLEEDDNSIKYLLISDDTPSLLRIYGISKYHLINSEYRGLKKLSNMSRFQIPEVFSYGSYQQSCHILTEYINQAVCPSVFTDRKLWVSIVEKLANNAIDLHQNKGLFYGDISDNYIGILPQSNKQHNNWADFYWYERIKPQLELAIKNKYWSSEKMPKDSFAIKIFETYFDDCKPTLIHGDFCIENTVISVSSTDLWLINPSSYYGHPIMDLARFSMNYVPSTFFLDFYMKKTDEFNKPIRHQIALGKLYYLLVNLNSYGTKDYLQSLQIYNRYLKP